jgi:hypothetical protein
MMRKILAVALGLALFAAPSARASVLAYALQGAGGGGGGSDFGVADLSTGAFTLLGVTGAPLSGIGNYGGAIYGGAYLFDAQPNAFYQVNPTNGSLTFIGNTSAPPGATGSTTAGVYEFDYNGNLYSINVATGASTLVGNTGIPMNGTCCGNGNVGMSAGGSNLYITQNSNLYLINTATGNASLVGSTSPAEFDGMAPIDGVYYGISLNGQVFSFDPNTADVTAGPNISTGTNWGLTPISDTPLPAALPLFATGLGALGLLGWRRKRKQAALALR